MAFAACLGLVLLFQLAARSFIELPELYKQEHLSDVHAVTQVQRAFALNLTHLEAVTRDTAHWGDAHAFMKTQRGGEAYAAFVLQEYLHTETMHVVPRVNGYAYFSLTGDLFFESTYDLENDAKGLPLPLGLDALPELPSGDYGALAGGFIDSELGPLQLVVASITDEEASLPAGGYLVIWRKFDDLFLREFVEPLGAQIRLSTFDASSARDRRLADDPALILSRDEHGDAHWLLRDLHGEPLLVVSQRMRPRTFNDGLLSTSSVVGFSASALLLAMLSLFVARSVIRPIVDASAFIEAVTRSNDYSRRLLLERNDEVGVVALRFNHLLAHVESQEEELRSHNARLEQLADRDSLTGTQNRRAFEKMLERDWALAMRSGSVLTCIMVDVDCFKAYNDHYGHLAGDDALKQVTGALERCVQRASDCICRYGGEEFIVLLIDTDTDAAERIAQAMVKAVRDLSIVHVESGCADIVTISAGVATVRPVPSEEPAVLINRADEALYRAKNNGRNQVGSDGAENSQQRHAHHLQ